MIEVVRVLVAVVCSLSVLALQHSPDLHVHLAGHAQEHVDRDHHQGAARHVHVAFPTREATKYEGSAWTDSDENASAVELSWLTSEQPKTRTAPPAVETFVFSPAPMSAAFDTSPERPRAHDPPGGSPSIPRAPPV